MPGIATAAITGGAAIFAAHKTAKGNTDAAKTQAASDDKALAQAKEIYQQQRADQGPYRESGYGSLDALNYGLGLPAVNRQQATAVPLPQSTVKGLEFPGAPQVPESTISNLTQLGSPGSRNNKIGQQMLDKIGGAQTQVNQQYGGSATGGGLTRMKAPNGFVYLVPADQVAAAQQKGGHLA